MRDRNGRFKKGFRSGIKTEFKKGNKPWNDLGKNCDGYVKITLSDGRRIREHRYVMEKYIGRKLKTDEVVHHINGNKKDNRIDNLQLMDRATHNRIDILHKRWGGIYV